MVLVNVKMKEVPVYREPCQELHISSHQLYVRSLELL